MPHAVEVHAIRLTQVRQTKLWQQVFQYQTVKFVNARPAQLARAHTGHRGLIARSPREGRLALLLDWERTCPLEVPLVGNVFKSIMDAHPGIAKRRLVHEAIRRLINMMVVDVIRETRRRVNALKIKSISDIRHADTAVVAFSDEMGEYSKVLRKFLMDNMYRHHRVNRMSSKARRIMKELFRIFHEEPECLPDEWRVQTDGAKTMKTAQVVCDYIAGMTDRYAINEYQKLFDISEKS